MDVTEAFNRVGVSRRRGGLSSFDKRRNELHASQQAAVECFVANAVATNLTKPRYGMTLARFETYGVAVSQILQTRQTYLLLVGVSGAVADAMPPTNSDGSANLLAQHHAITDIVRAASAAGFASIPANATLQDMEWFALDVSGAMNDNAGFLQLLTPGVSLRMIDSYVVTATAGSQVNWTEVETNLTNAVNAFVKAGLIKIPAGMTASPSDYICEFHRPHHIYLQSRHGAKLVGLVTWQ